MEIAYVYRRVCMCPLGSPESNVPQDQGQRLAYSEVMAKGFLFFPLAKYMVKEFVIGIRGLQEFDTSCWRDAVLFPSLLRELNKNKRYTIQSKQAH